MQLAGRAGAAAQAGEGHREAAAAPGAELTSPGSPASPRPTGPFFPLRSASLAPVSTSVIRDTHTLVGSVTEMPINK